MELATRHQKIRQVTLIGGAVNCLLAFLKIIAGIWGHSHALLADGLHSIADLLSDALVLIAAKYSHRAADHNHPYGHGRIETLVTVAVAALIIAAGFGILIDAAQSLLHHHSQQPVNIAILAIAFFSVVLNELTFHYTLFVAKRLNAQVLMAQAWHRRSDAASSLIVLLGIMAAYFGVPHGDSIAAILVALIIIKMGISLAWTSLSELVDTAVDAITLEEIRSIIVSCDGVQAIHQLRTRLMNQAIFIDVHILVNPYLSVSEGHQISQRVHFTLVKKIPLIKDVTVHIDPEDDEVFATAYQLPTRQELWPQLKQRWQDLPGIAEAQLTIHYLNGQLELVLVFPLAILASQPLTDLYPAYIDAIKDLDFIRSLHLHVSYPT